MASGEHLGTFHTDFVSIISSCLFLSFFPFVVMLLYFFSPVFSVLCSLGACQPVNSPHTLTFSCCVSKSPHSEDGLSILCSCYSRETCASQPVRIWWFFLLSDHLLCFSSSYCHSLKLRSKAWTSLLCCCIFSPFTLVGMTLPPKKSALQFLSVRDWWKPSCSWHHFLFT